MLNNSTSPSLIAPCGIDCRLCHAYIRDKKSCPGCLGDDRLKTSTYCTTCPIKHCDQRAVQGIESCVDCDIFPCTRLAHLDKRYITKYATSPIANLISIKEIGIEKFVENENETWACPQCGVMLCMHKPQCLNCGYVWHENL